MRYYYLDKNGSTLFGRSFQEAHPFSSGLALVSEGGGRFVNKKGELVHIDGEGFINRKGETVFKLKLGEVDVLAFSQRGFTFGYCWLLINEAEFYVDRTGRLIGFPKEGLGSDRFRYEW